MLLSTVNPKASVVPVTAADVCNTCCCEPLHVKAGETIPMVIDYAPWSIPIAAHGRGLGCSPAFNVEQVTSCPAPSGDNLPPNVPNLIPFATPINTDLDGDLKTFVTDPESDNLSFKVLPFFGVSFGKLELADDGTFTYTPWVGFTGYDRFYFIVEDGVNNPITGQAVIGVGQPLPTDVQVTPKVRVRPSSVRVNQQVHTVWFAIEIGPDAKPCETYRLTVRMNAIDCDGGCYWNNSCYDLIIGQCK